MWRIEVICYEYFSNSIWSEFVDSIITCEPFSTISLWVAVFLVDLSDLKSSESSESAPGLTIRILVNLLQVWQAGFKIIVPVRDLGTCRISVESKNLGLNPWFGYCRISVKSKTLIWTMREGWHFFTPKTFQALPLNSTTASVVAKPAGVWADAQRFSQALSSCWWSLMSVSG